MTKNQIYKELNLTDDYFIYVYYETEKIVFINVGKDRNPPQVTTGKSLGCYAKWKNKDQWFTPHFPTDLEVYKEIHNCINKANKL